jgi:hypothetical protein
MPLAVVLPLLAKTDPRRGPFFGSFNFVHDAKSILLAMPGDCDSVDSATMSAGPIQSKYHRRDANGWNRATVPPSGLMIDAWWLVGRLIGPVFRGENRPRRSPQFGCLDQTTLLTDALGRTIDEFAGKVKANFRALRYL